MIVFVWTYVSLRNLYENEFNSSIFFTMFNPKTLNHPTYRTLLPTIYAFDRWFKSPHCIFMSWHCHQFCQRMPQLPNSTTLFGFVRSHLETINFILVIDYVAFIWFDSDISSNVNFSRKSYMKNLCWFQII
jgi:hypothetical protein